jgi:hypothetical protein
VSALSAPFAAVAGRLFDRANPIVVKELRQAVRSKLVMAILLLFLLVNLGAIGTYVMFGRDVETSETGGRDLFLTLLSVLAITCVCVVPLYAGARLSIERSDSNTDLLFATTIKPSAIIRGKFWAAMAMTLLVYSCCAPFLSVTYLLRGIDLPTVFFLLGMGLVVIAAAVMVAMLAGALPGGLIWRIILGLGLLVVLIIFTSSCISAAVGMSYTGVLGTVGWGFWAAVGTTVLGLVAGIGLMYVLAVAAITPARANRMLPVRIYVFCTWVVLGVVSSLWAWHDSVAAMIPWVVVGMATMNLGLFVAIAEREDWSPRISKTIPRLWPLRVVAWLFYTGSAGAVIWCCLGVAGTALWGALAIELKGTAGGMFVRPSDLLHDSIVNSVGIFLYTFCYCMTAVLLRRLLRSQGRKVFVSLTAAILMAVGMLVPLVGAYLSQGRLEPGELPFGSLLASPTGLLDDRPEQRLAGWIVVVVWSCLMVVLCVPWAYEQWRRFRYHPALPGPQEPPLAPADPARSPTS